MKPRILMMVLAVLALLALPAGAGAHGKPYLTMKRGEAMIRANAMLDQPERVVLSGCYRNSRRSISCFVREIGHVHTLIEDNGEYIVADEFSYEGTASL